MRLEVTRKADLAVQVVAALSAVSRLKSRALAEAVQTTPGFVAQVMNPLVKAGFVRSEPGPTGGYSLNPEAREVSVLDVIEAVDGPTETGTCVVADRACAGGQACALHGAWSRARHTLLDTLARTPAVATTTVAQGEEIL